MGMCARYMEISDAAYKEIVENDRYDMIYDLWDRADTNKADIDKTWNVLHFLLTGESAMYRLEDNLLSNIVLGHMVIDETALLAYSAPAKVKEIAKEITGINFTDLLATLDMQKHKAAELYPDIWGYEVNNEDIMRYLSDNFDRLKQLYCAAAEHRNGVLVMID